MRWLLPLTVCLALLASPVGATWPGGGSHLGFGVGIGGGGGPPPPPPPAYCAGTNYYVSNQGSDSNNGTSTGTPWQTTAKVMAKTNYAATDCINFNGQDAVCTGSIASNGVMTITGCSSGTIHVKDPVSGTGVDVETQVTGQIAGTTGGIGTYNTFSGVSQTVPSGTTLTFGQTFTVGGRVNNAACFYLDQTNVPSGGGVGFAIQSYGGGNAAILSNSTCASQPGNQGTNLSALVQINGIAMTWDRVNLYANGTNTAVGLVLVNDFSPNSGAFTFQNSAVIGMQKALTDTAGDNQHSLWINNGYKFASVNILNNTVAGCCGSGSVNSNTEEGIVIGGEMDYYNVEGNIVENIEGRPLPITDTGALMGSVTRPTNRSYFRHNLLRYGGGNVNSCGGMSGIEIVSGGSNVIVEYNEIHHMRSLHGYGCDADGIDFDGDSTDAIAQYNYTHDNQGVGYLAWIGGTWGPNVYRYNVSENDGGGFQTSGGGEIGARIDVYNNTFYTTSTSATPISFGTSDMPTGIVANNILGGVNASGDVNFIDCYSNPLVGSSLQLKNNAYLNLSGTGNFKVRSCSGSYTSLAAWQAAVPGGETGAFTSSNAAWQGPVPRSTECNSTPANHQGPQPCPVGYKLTDASTAFLGTGLNLTSSPFSLSVGSTDYWLNAIPNGTGTGYNIGAHGAVPGAVSSARKGFNADVLSLSSAALTAQLTDMKTLGASWIRLDFDWSQMQAINSVTYDTAAWDRVATAAAAAGLKVIGIIDYTPSWANGGRPNQFYPPTSAATYGTFAGYLATRYGPMGVHTWEIWNEPNLGGVFWQSGADPTGYTNLLIAAYPAIKAADPTATVLTGGMSPAADSAPDMTPQTFLQGIYDAGGHNYFDAVAHHPYTYPAMPDATDGSAYWWEIMADLYGIMSAGSDSGKKIWMTEYGTPTSGDSSAVTEAQQATMITKAYNLQATYPWAGPLIIYNYKNSGSNLSNTEDNFGIIRFNGTQKPAYNSFKALPP